MPANLRQYVESLERAQRHWQSRQEAGARAGLTIALTREAGTPGTTVAQEVGRRIGWLVYDHELVQRIAQEMGLRASLLESVDERNPGWLRETFQAFADVPQVTSNSYVHQLVQTILSLGAHGHCIIVGRGAAHILPPDTTLRVRLYGQLKDRIAATAQRLGLSEEQAARWVEETDRERLHFIKEHFQKDPTDPQGYDLLLSSSRWTVPECADLIVQAVRCREARGKHVPAS
jgi:cytidylate kinase